MDSTETETGRRLYQIHVGLRDITPRIWRRIQVWEDCTLHQLHRVLQTALGWENYHLYEFRIGKEQYRDPHPENEPKIRNARRARIGSVLSAIGAACVYLYDFGDGWEHDLVLEAVLAPAPNELYPLCVAGDRSGPPEDVGGPFGYEQYLQALADPDHERHEEWIGWRGPFDPEAFSIAGVNELLKRKFRPVRKRALPFPNAPQPKTAPPAAKVSSANVLRPAVPRKKRIRILPDETVPLELSARERELILQRISTAEELVAPLRAAHQSGHCPIFRFTLDDLDELGGCVAAEANHAKDRHLREELLLLFVRIQTTLDGYTDEPLIN